MRKVLVLAVALAALTIACWATVAWAEDEAARDATRADVRCVLAMTIVMRDDTYRSAGALGLYYFSGRIDARNPDIDLAEAVRHEARQMQSSQYAVEIRRCNEAVQAKVKSFEAFKAAFEKRGVGR